MKGFPKGFYTCLVCAFLALCLTGFMLIPNMLDIHFSVSMAKQWPSIWLQTLLKMHGGLAFLGALLLGALLSVHVRIGLYKKQKMVSGIILILVLFLLILSGWGIHYLGNQWLLMLASASHTALGAVMVFVFFWHVFYGRFKRVLNLNNYWLFKRAGFKKMGFKGLGFKEADISETPPHGLRLGECQFSRQSHGCGG
jgi:hypothetical protein